MTLQVIDLTRPHGFLIWHEKQRSIASPSPLPVGDVLITSDGEVFGVATLGQPIQVSLSEFERQEYAEKHCIRVEERLELWPNAQSFYLYDIKGWKGFGQPWLIVQPTSEILLDDKKKLLKTIIIHPDAITQDEIGGINKDELSVTLEATFNCVLPDGDKALPFYKLVLDGRPKLKFEGVKKKEVTEMPYEINDNNCVINEETGEEEGCHDSREEAEAHLTALNLNVHKGEDKAGRRLAGSWRDKLRAAKDALMELVNWAEYADEIEEEVMMVDLMKMGESGIGFKLVNGEPWHLSWSSNSFEDRDNEIFSLKSLEQYVDENSENEVKGYFNLWHIRNTDFAEKRFQAVIGKFLFEAGPYLKDEKGQKALNFFKQYPNGHPEVAPEGWGASVEYKYLPEERKEKVYKWTWITRTSTLARGAAANVWTKSTQQESIMNDEQRKASVAIFGEEFTKNLETQGQQKTKELEEAGVANKAAEENLTEVNEETQTLVVDTDKLIEVLSAKMTTHFNEGLTPVLQTFHDQIVQQGQQLQSLVEEVKALKGEQALKAAVELPRFTFQALQASRSNQTIVPEGDALKDKKPLEAANHVDSGSLTQAYFPRKG